MDKEKKAETIAEMADSLADFVIRTAIALGVPPLAAYRAASWSAARAFALTSRQFAASVMARPPSATWRDADRSARQPV